MLRITIQDDALKTTIKLEGKIAGPWVEELNRTWHSLGSGLDSKRFCVDLRDVAFVDRAGKQVLREIFQKTEAEFLTNSPLTRYFADEAREQRSEN